MGHPDREPGAGLPHPVLHNEDAARNAAAAGVHEGDAFHLPAVFRVARRHHAGRRGVLLYPFAAARLSADGGAEHLVCAG